MFKSTYIHIIWKVDYSMMFYFSSFQDVVVLCGLQPMNMYGVMYDTGCINIVLRIRTYVSVNSLRPAVVKLCG